MIMQCGRKGCENILCSRYSEKHGYICGECFDELIDECEKYYFDIDYFMKSRKREKKSDRIMVTKALDKIFPKT